MPKYSKVPAEQEEESQDDQELVASRQGELHLTTDGLIASLQTSESPEDDSITEPDGTSSAITVITVDEAIERLGMGRFQILILTASGLCFAADAMQVLLLTFLSEVLRSDWNLTDNETAMITSILFVGAIFGTLTLGPLADRKGRKPVFLLAGSIISCFGLAVAIISSYWALLANLFMVGWGVGGLTGAFFLCHSAFHLRTIIRSNLWFLGSHLLDFLLPFQYHSIYWLNFCHPMLEGKTCW